MVAVPILALELRGSDGSTGRAVRGGQRSPSPGTSLPSRGAKRRDGAASTGSTLLGAQSALGPMGRTYSEYRWLHDGDETRTQVRRRPGAGVALCLRTFPEIEAESTPLATARPEAGRGLRSPPTSATGGDSRSLPTTRNEYRIDGGRWARTEMLTSSGLNGTSSRESPARELSSQFHERTAWPTSHRRGTKSGASALPSGRALGCVEGLARWTLLRDRRFSAPGDTTLTETTLGVTALEATVRFLPGIDWVGKARADPRRRFVAVSGSGTTHSVLWAQRLEYTVSKAISLWSRVSGSGLSARWATGAPVG